MAILKKSEVRQMASNATNVVNAGNVPQKEHAPETKSTWYSIQKIIVLLLWVFTFFVYLFSNTQILSFWFGDWSYKAQIWGTIFPYLLIFSVVITLVFFYLLDKLKSREIKQTSSIIITHPELQYKKIRDWASKHHGLQLGNCVSVERSPRLGEASAVPHTLHYLFEIIKRGKVVGFAWIDNSLFKDINVFWLIKINAFVRDTPNRFWTGEPKNYIPTSISETSVGKRGLRVPTQREWEEVEEEESAT